MKMAKCLLDSVAQAAALRRQVWVFQAMTVYKLRPGMTEFEPEP